MGTDTLPGHSPGVRQFGALHKVHALLLLDILRDPRAEIFLLRIKKGTLRPWAITALFGGSTPYMAELPVQLWGPLPRTAVGGPGRGSQVWVPAGGSLPRTSSFSVNTAFLENRATWWIRVWTPASVLARQQAEMPSCPPDQGPSKPNAPVCSLVLGLRESGPGLGWCSGPSQSNQGHQG